LRAIQSLRMGQLWPAGRNGSDELGEEPQEVIRIGHHREMATADEKHGLFGRTNLLEERGGQIRRREAIRAAVDDEERHWHLVAERVEVKPVIGAVQDGQ
jgi:hypothetical protein